MQSNFRIAAWAALVSSFFGPAHAGTDQPTVEVAASRYDVRRDDTATRIVVGHDELVRQGDRTLADVLKRLPGITVGDAAGRGSEIRMRGLGNGYTQILVDGVAAPAGFSLESLAPELVERVDIIRTASAELGTQAIAGTINIILRKTAASPRRDMRIGDDIQAGSHSPFVDGEISGKADWGNYSLSGKLGRTRIATPSIDDESAYDALGNRALHRHTDRHEIDVADRLNLSSRLRRNLQAGGTLDWQTFGDFSRNAVTSEAHEQTLVGGPSALPDNSSDIDATASTLHTDLGWTRELADGVRLDLKAGGNVSRRHSNFAFAGMPVEGGIEWHRVESAIREGGYRVDGKVTLPAAGAHALTVGWNASHAARSQSRIEHDLRQDIPFAASDDRYHGTINQYALFAEDELTIDAAWSISAGLRWDSLRTTIVATASPAVALPAVERNSNMTSPLLQALYKWSAERRLRIGLTRTWKAPVMGELIPRRYTTDNNNNATNPDTQGNAALQPERAWGLDIAYDHHVGKDALFSASAYARRIDDVILPLLFRDGAAWVSTPANQGRALVRGVALEAKFPWRTFTADAADAPDLDIRFNIARNWSRVDSVPGPDNRLNSQAPLSANIGIDHRLRGKALAWGADFHVRSGGFVQLSERTSAYGTMVRELDLHATWNADRRTRLRLGISNLLRRDRLAEDGYRDPDGRHLTATTTPTFATLRLTLEHEFGN